jgi:erythromycin esterase
VDGFHAFLSTKQKEKEKQKNRQLLLNEVKKVLKEGIVHKLENFNKKDLDPLLESIGDARYVLLGEASHGTSEFYTWRAEITKRLITEKGFSFIAVEGDWPDCYRVNRYVKGMKNSGSLSAYEVLYAFSRWPTWMWANREIVDLIEWLRSHNKGVENRDKKVGFYGLDVYSLWESLEAVMQYLQKNYPDTMKSAIDAYRCFEPYGRDVEEYAKATAFIPESCEDEVANVLIELRRKADGGGDHDIDKQFKADGREAHFNAEQNAVVAKNAELYYRTMMKGGAASWNVRDHHMMNTLERLMKFHGGDAKSIVWAHNTHIGDARATDMARAKMVNLGQLAREQAGRNTVVLVGFGTYKGSVIASKEWGKAMERMSVPSAIDESWDSFLHSFGDNDVGQNKLLTFDDTGKIKTSALFDFKGQRAIGVVYNPSYEKFGNYVETILPVRYDAFLFIDETHALHPLHMPVSQDEELPETFPTGL